MGGGASNAHKAWLAVRPGSCDPYIVQRDKVLRKFDRVRISRVKQRWRVHAADCGLFQESFSESTSPILGFNL